MKLEEKYKKNFVAITVTILLCVVGANAVVGTIVVENWEVGQTFRSIFVIENEKEEGAIAMMLIGALIGVYVASVLLPLIANKTAELEDNSDLDSGEQDLVGTWVLFIILGVMGAIIGMAL